VAFSVDGTTLAAFSARAGKIYFVDPTAGEIKSSLNVGLIGYVLFSRFSHIL